MYKNCDSDTAPMNQTKLGTRQKKAPTQPTATGLIAQAKEALDLGVACSLDLTPQEAAGGDDWNALEALLESLPLPTAQFALATQHLNNAKDYVAAGEFGAAKFELKMMLGGLK